MAIECTQSEEEFIALLNEYVSASSPIKSIQHLRGREIHSRTIERGLRSPGRSVFIYGDRGVGKTSLAQTSAYKFNSSNSSPSIISVDANSTFFSIMHDLTSQAAGLRPDLISKKSSFGGSAGYRGLSIEAGKEIETGKVPIPTSINEAVALVEFFFPDSENDSVVVIDEFERLSSQEERALFADFIKQVGDRKLGLKFIFCGIATSLEDLLAAHHSCYRYLETIRLERLEWAARSEIIEGVAGAFGVSIPIEIVWRISAISDGYPYYIHIVCEKLFWIIFDEADPVSLCSQEMFNEAVNSAVLNIEPTLRSTYEKATRKYNNDYEQVLWAAADHSNLERRSADIHRSYYRIMKELRGVPLPSTKLANRLNVLKKPTHASILIGTRTGWYRFDENVIRGYVRLRAQQEGVELDARSQDDATSEVSPARGSRESSQA